jgi:glycosyltransferase involved in cell wall biosynthesis
MMHVMLLAPGISIHSQRFLQMLLDAGHIVTLIDIQNPKPEGAERYTFIPYPSMLGLDRFRHLNKTRLIDWISAVQLRLIWKRLHPDVVHVHWVDARAYACALARLHPLVLTCWGSDINHFFDSSIMSDRQRQKTTQALLMADHITADTNQVLVRCETRAGRKLPTSLFYFGIDLAKFKADYPNQAKALRAKLGISPSTKLVLSVRRPVPQMGHHHILRAFADALVGMNLDAVLVIKRYLVETNEYEQELSQLATDLGIARRVIWIEGVANDEMLILYAASDIIVNFPVYDGLPVSLFEAAACKRPIVTADLPGYREFLEKGAFIVVPPGDIAKLTDALKSVLRSNSHDLSSALETNYALVARVADQKKCISGMIDTYENLVSRAQDPKDR